MVIAIICIVTLVVFVRQQSFDSSTLLRSLAYSVALSFEQAQAYDVGVRGFTPTAGATQFTPGYGVYFAQGSIGSYNIFADLNGNHLDDMGENLPAYLLNTGYQINNVCGILTNSTEHSCLVNDASGGSTLSWIEVYFKRPDPDAYFYSSATGETYSAVYVSLRANNDAVDTRYVKVTPTGEISVCALNANPANC